MDFGTSTWLFGGPWTCVAVEKRQTDCWSLWRQ